MASPPAIESVAKIVAAEEGERVVVVSATAGTTDALVKAADQAVAGDAGAAQQTIERLSEQHRNLIADVVGVNGAEALREIVDLTERTIALLRSVALLRECSARSLDAILSYGERVSAPIIAAALQARGTQAEALSTEGLLITDDAFGHANPLLELTREAIEKQLVPRMRYGTVPVVTGFIGSTVDGVTTTLGRGGSDYSAAVVSNTRAANPGTPLIPAPCTVTRPSPPSDVVAFTTVLSSGVLAAIVVPGSSGANVFRIRTGIPASIAGSTVRGWMTLAPKYESSAASA